MSDITKFEDFKNQKIKDFNRTKEFQPLSNDIIAFKDFTNTTSAKIHGIEKIEGTIKIISITDIITDPEKIKYLEEMTDNTNIGTDLNEKEIKRDDVVWLVAFVQKPTTTSWESQTFHAIIKCKIADFGILLVK
jgi:hypothetical protein